ncbi:MAG TPA: CHAD domain-containing protein, partial [Rhodocyclaceae bacterium]|nr:CHAD domain-containing protein [Rhodocyclaceae bacterium]
APALIWEAYARVRAYEPLIADAPIETLHALRIEGKRLRYTLEFFSCLLPARRLKPYLATLNQLQDELGLINDHVTAIDLVAQLPGKLPQGPVLGWLHGRHALLIEELPEMLETWLAQPAPWKRK